MIEYAYSLTGGAFPVIKEFDIDAATVIKKGEVVKLTAGKVTSLGETTQTETYLGVTQLRCSASESCTFRLRQHGTCRSSVCDFPR
jgi:hypothetical protein